MNWKNGDMAVLKSHPDSAPLKPVCENSICKVHGPCLDSESALAFFLMTGYRGQLWWIESTTLGNGVIAEVNLHPIQDPDQQAEPRETQIKRPCVA